MYDHTCTCRFRKHLWFLCYHEGVHGPVVPVLRPMHAWMLRRHPSPQEIQNQWCIFCLNSIRCIGVWQASCSNKKTKKKSVQTAFEQTKQLRTYCISRDQRIIGCFFFDSQTCGACQCYQCQLFLVLLLLLLYSRVCSCFCSCSC